MVDETAERVADMEVFMLREEMCDRSVELEEAGLGEEEVLGACIEFLEDRLSQLYRELYEMEG